MKKKIDVVLQQTLENNRDSIVCIVAGYVEEQPVGFDDEDVVLSTYAKIASGFFVAPDKIVTTINVIAGGIGVTAIPSHQFQSGNIPILDGSVKKSINKDIDSFSQQNSLQIDADEVGYTIEGVSAFDAKNNLVVLKIAETGVPLSFGNSDAFQREEFVYSLGYLENMKYSGTAGKFLSSYRNNTWFQIETPFLSTLGGGPVVNRNNEVIGVFSYNSKPLHHDSNRSIARLVASNVLSALMSKSEKVIPLGQWQKYSQIRAYDIEYHADGYSAAENNSEAVKNYNSALILNPDLVEIYAKRGIVKNRIFNTEEALKDFTKAIQINPEDFYSYNNRATANGYLGVHEAMIGDLNEAIKINPKYEIAYLNRGQANAVLGDIKKEEDDIVGAQQCYEAAIGDLIKTLELNRKHSIARRSLKKVRSKLKRLSYG